MKTLNPCIIENNPFMVKSKKLEIRKLRKSINKYFELSRHNGNQAVSHDYLAITQFQYEGIIS